MSFGLIGWSSVKVWRTAEFLMKLDEFFMVSWTNDNWAPSCGVSETIFLTWRCILWLIQTTKGFEESREILQLLLQLSLIENTTQSMNPSHRKDNLKTQCCEKKADASLRWAVSLRRRRTCYLLRQCRYSSRINSSQASPLAKAPQVPCVAHTRRSYSSDLWF